jgi:hypothetical protein
MPFAVWKVAKRNRDRKNNYFDFTRFGDPKKELGS